MLKRRLDLLIATMVITVGGVSTVYAQPWVPGIPGITQNPNAAGNVGINISPTPPVPGVGVAWDPLEISFPGMGLPPALRLSGTSTPPGPPFIMPMDYAQLGYALGAFQFSTLATTNDLVLATQGSSEDVIITANGKNTGQIRFATHTTGGVETERMTILDNTGNVGIGTTTPSEQLEVSGNVEFSGTLMPGGFAGASGQILQSNGAIMPPSWINPSAAGGAWIYGGNNPGTAQTLGTTTPVDLPFITSNATRMTIGAGGNVGIGTAPSVYRLEVSGDVHVSTDLDIAGLLRINGSSGTAGYVLMSNGLSSPGWVDAGVQFAGTFWKVNGQTIGSAGTYDLGPTGAGENLRIIADTGTPMYFPSTGNIGINAPTPGALLDVNGLVRCVKLTAEPANDFETLSVI